MGGSGSLPLWLGDHSMSYVARLPTVDQANYVDPVTRAYAKTPGWGKGQIEDANETPDKVVMEKWNIASLGNIAYMALHAPEPETRALSETILARVRSLYAK